MTCAHLETKDGLSVCRIYEDRPAICRVGYSRPKAMKLDEYHSLSAAACNEIQSQEGMDEAWRVRIE